MSVTGVIAEFATGNYSLVRAAVGAYVNGRYAPGASSVATIVACIQPIRGRELMSLPEGQRADENKVVYTTTEIKTRTPDTDPDRLIIDGEAWEAWRVERWEAFGTTHYRAYVSRLLTGTATGVAAPVFDDSAAGGGTVV